MRFLNVFSNILRWDYSDIQDDPVYKNEVQANQATALALLCCAAAMAIVCVMVSFGWLWYDLGGFLIITAACIFVLAVPALICFYYRGRRGWIKFMLVLDLLVVISLLYIVLCVDVLILISLPMVLSIRYFSRKLTSITIISTYVMFFVAVVFNVLANVHINVTVLDLSGVTIHVHGPLVDAIQEAAMVAYGDSYTDTVLSLELLNDFIPNGLMLVLFSIISLSAVVTGRKLLEEGVAIAESTAHLKSELRTAYDIQLGMLPDSSSGRREYDLFCSMAPAKEVGGDLYDYFEIDEGRLAVIVADVSGKGVPAALFMAIAKTLLKDNLSSMEPDKAVTRVNQMLCNNNKAGLFVTAWVGVVDLRNDRLTYVNAGHNPPLIRRGEGCYEYLESDPDLVLAAVDGYVYSQSWVPFVPGDRLFLYTDGVTEARSGSNGMYGEERLRDFLNSNPAMGPERLVKALKDDVDGFTKGVDQFDDITMLSFYYLDGRVFNADRSELRNVQDYVCDAMDGAPHTELDTNMVKVCVEEVFVNIADYAYSGKIGTVKVAADLENGALKVRFIDSGIPFNPLLREDPDISLSSDDRDIGGLGILITKTYFDRIEYDRSDNRNILTLCKSFEATE